MIANRGKTIAVWLLCLIGLRGIYHHRLLISNGQLQAIVIIYLQIKILGEWN